MELVGHGLSGRIVDALAAACHPTPTPDSSVRVMATVWLATAEGWAAAQGAVGGIVAVHERVDVDVDGLVATLFEQEAHRLVRLVRLFVDDRNAAEDLVQEGFIRFARNAHQLRDQAKAAAYLRSIVLNLARDENRRGLVSLRHQTPADDQESTAEDEVVLRDDQRQVIDAVRELAPRQRDCVVLRHFYEAGIPEIADTLGISQNSVKTHLKRGMARLGELLEEPVS